MEQRSPGAGPAIWAFTLIGFFGLGLVGVVVSVWGALSPDPLADRVSMAVGTRQWQVYHDHSPDHDGSSGCAVTPDAVVRWDADTETSRVPLRGAAASYQANRGVTVVGADGSEMFCPFEAGEGGEDFADWVVAESRMQHDGAVAPRDPRLTNP